MITVMVKFYSDLSIFPFAPHDSRITSAGDKITFWLAASFPSPSISCMRRQIADWPIPPHDHDTVVRGTRSISP